MQKMKWHRSIFRKSSRHQDLNKAYFDKFYDSLGQLTIFTHVIAERSKKNNAYAARATHDFSEIEPLIVSLAITVDTTPIKAAMDIYQFTSISKAAR